MSESASDDHITVYSDYVCPFCYLGRESLRRYQATRDDRLQIDWRPFDLRSHKRSPDGTIDHSVDDGKDEEYFEQAKQGVRRLQQRYDVEMDLDIAEDIDSLPAQIASYEVRNRYDYETWLAFDEAVFDALWQDGRDIGSTEVLVELATEVGIDGEEIRAALDDETLRDEVHERFAEAQQQGLTSSSA